MSPDTTVLPSGQGCGGTFSVILLPCENLSHMGMYGHFQNPGGGGTAQSPEEGLCSYWGCRTVGRGGLLGAWHWRVLKPQALPSSVAPPPTESSG